MSHTSFASAGIESGAPALQSRAALCAGVLPVWARHLATSRAQCEAAVSQMLCAFARIAPHIGLAQRQAQQIAQALSPANADADTVDLAHALAQQVDQMYLGFQYQSHQPNDGPARARHGPLTRRLGSAGGRVRSPPRWPNGLRA